MTKRKSRLTKEDWDNIATAMMFVDAGEWPFSDPDEDDAANEARQDSFERTMKKVFER